MRKIISFLPLYLLLFSCVSTEIVIEDVAKRAALLATKPVLEKIFYAEAPLAPSNRDLFQTVQKLPGQSFEPKKYFGNRLQLSNGTVELLPGDYIVPVMTYCMKSSGASPSNHRYQLGKLSGRAAQIIRDLNAKALLKFRPEEIQAASWSIQNGVPFDEMPVESKKIIDAVIPEHRKELEKSFFRSFSEKWDGIADKMGLPRFDEVTDQTLDSLGELGQEIRALREFRRTLRESGGNYENLRSLITLPGVSENLGTEATTSWSQISERVYARFLITGHYLDVGELQIRVVASLRSPKSLKNDAIKIDVSSFVADPGKGGIQPLSFSPIFGSLAIPYLTSANPAVVAAFLAALIAAEYTDWEAVGKALEKFGSSTQEEVQWLVEKLRRLYATEFGGKPGEVKHPPLVPPAFPGLTRAQPKTPRPGGKLRRRWKDADGNIYEWDYRHGRLEKYNNRGNHQGEYDPDTGQQTKPRNPKYRVDP